MTQKLTKNERATEFVQARMLPDQKERLRAIAIFYEETESVVIRRLIYNEYKRLVKSGDISV